MEVQTATIPPDSLPRARQAGAPSPSHLPPIVAKDPHHADRNSLVQTAPQSFAVESKHKGDVLLTGVVNDGVQGVVQPTWSKDNENDKEVHHTSMLVALATNGFSRQ